MMATTVTANSSDMKQDNVTVNNFTKHDIIALVSNTTTADVYNGDSDDDEDMTCYVYTVVCVGVIQLALFLLAVLGNCMCFVTWCKIGKVRGYHSSVLFLQSLSISDMLSQLPILLLIILPFMITESGLQSNNYYNLYISAYVFTYGWPLASIGNCMTVWVTTQITIHRFMVISRPFSSLTQKLTSLKSSSIQLIILWIVAIGYQIPRFLEHKVVKQDLAFGGVVNIVETSNVGFEESYKFYYITLSFLLLVNVTPLLLCACFTLNILCLLHKANKQRSQMSAASSAKSKESSTTKTLITVVIIFIICQTPNTVLRVYMAIQPQQLVVCGSPLFYFYPLTIIFISINSSINIFVYTTCSKEFRQMCVGLLRCCCHTTTPQSSSVSVIENTTAI